MLLRATLVEEAVEPEQVPTEMIEARCFPVISLPSRGCPDVYDDCHVHGVDSPEAGRSTSTPDHERRTSGLE